jgi:glycosyltransferase involved in cell wall biosynthesis
LNLLKGTVESNDPSLGKMISIIIPVYNRADTLKASLQRIRDVISSISSNYEIIVVNDGSTDDTLQVMQGEQKSDSRLKVITYSGNMGKGYAVRKGVMDSRGGVVVFADGDLDISPIVISDYVKQLQSSELVIGSKRHPLSKVSVPASRRFLSRAFNLIVRLATGIKVGDTQSGLKAGNGDVLRAIFRLMLVKRYAFDVEMLAIANMLGIQTKEMPIELKLDRRFKSKEVVRMFVDVLAVAYRYRIKRYYQKQAKKDATLASR